ncbi:unnamed protein product [Ceutorhynchus assimilis]|uniref:ADP-ribosylation factor-like protein 2-binding protein n=1 Tax=Ceutorhynchus assimilis TaxID=467358 RepID=A0A9N9MRL7_9CUCU|nr:unnamed protein product [Ceutorhynchus assimilis]
MTDMDCKCQVEQNSEANDTDISHYCLDDYEKSFAQIVGCIENIVISDEFLEIQNTFFDKYYSEFVDVEENRLIYMDIFKQYLDIVEKYIEKELVKNIPAFDIRMFEMELKLKPNELDGEIYEMLSSFWDFAVFKNMFLEYKQMKEGKALDLTGNIWVKKYDFQ